MARTVALAAAALVYRAFRTDTRWPAPVALALLIFVFILTLAVNLPINADQVNWNAQAPPADWAAVRDRWQAAHAVRTAAGVLAFAALALAAPPPRRSQ
jgi:hypothetical protein